jgi:hypothetical protein
MSKWMGGDQKGNREGLKENFELLIIFYLNS